MDLQPTPPHKEENYFFAFLDELDHFMYTLKKSVTMTSDPPHTLFSTLNLSLIQIKKNLPTFSFYGQQNHCKLNNHTNEKDYQPLLDRVVRCGVRRLLDLVSNSGLLREEISNILGQVKALINSNRSLPSSRLAGAECGKANLKKYI